MATSKVESRLAALEVKVATLEQKIDRTAAPDVPWWQHVVGAFADDPDFLEAMRLGREYRESLRPKAARRPKSAKRKKA